jgi:hypothetical protein
MHVIHRARVSNAVFVVLAFAALVFAMYPGRFDGDAINQYYQGVAYSFEDAHSVMIAALLGILSDIAKGPGPMFVMQLLLWLGGVLIFTDALIASGHSRTGQIVSLLSVVPLLSLDFFDVQKDALFSGLLAILLGVGARIVIGRPPITVIGAFGTFCAGVLALDSRQNAFFALIPLWLLAKPIQVWQPRVVAASLLTGLVAFAAAEAAVSWIDNDVLHTRHSHAIYALIIFDLAGITAATHQDASRGILPDFQANAEKCYSPHEWNPFSDGACPSVGSAAQQLVASGDTRRALVSTWVRAIALHPVAYLRHRLMNFGCLIRIGCGNNYSMIAGWGHRPWDDRDIRLTVSVQPIGMAAYGMWAGPLGSGALWISVLLCELAISAAVLWRRGHDAVCYLAMTIASAGLSYVFGFAVVGIADQLRYLHPVFFLGLIDAPLVATAVLRDHGANRSGHLPPIARLRLRMRLPWAVPRRS